MLIRYILFAILASALNIAVQWLITWFCNVGLTSISNPVAEFVQNLVGMKPGSLFLYLGMTGGTISGLVFKYILDKKYVFDHRAENKRKEAATFFLYSFMGLLTTLIFWSVEMGFYFLFDTETSKYIGGALGLAIGYVVKFFLDRRFVFKNQELLF